MRHLLIKIARPTILGRSPRVETLGGVKITCKLGVAFFGVNIKAGLIDGIFVNNFIDLIKADVVTIYPPSYHLTVRIKLRSS